MHLHRLTLRAKLLAGFGLIAALVLIVSALSLRALAAGHADYALYVTETAARLSLANDVLDAANARALEARNVVLLTDAAERGRAKAATAAAHEKIGRSLAKLKEMLAASASADAQERSLAATIAEREARYGPVAQEIVGLAAGDRREEAIARMNTQCRPLLASLLQAAEAYVSDAVTQLDQVTQQNAALVEESAAAAESLKQQAARLAELVQVFRLEPAAG